MELTKRKLKSTLILKKKEGGIIIVLSQRIGQQQLYIVCTDGEMDDVRVHAESTAAIK